MARGESRETQETFNYDDVKRRTFNYPKGYYLEEVESVEENYDDDGRKNIVIRCTVIGPEQYEGAVVHHRFRVGMLKADIGPDAENDDLEAEDPETWKHPNNYGAYDGMSFLVACGVLEGEKGKPTGVQKRVPYKMSTWAAAEGKEFIDQMGIRIPKKGQYAGEKFQSHRYWQTSEREPEIFPTDDDATPRRRATSEGRESRPARTAARSRDDDSGDPDDSGRDNVRDLPPRTRRRA